MKKLILSVAIATLTWTGFAQITFLKELKGVAIIQSYQYSNFNTDYFCLRTTLTELTIYDNNFNVIKTISGLPEANQILLIYKNVFTSSGLFEFIVAAKDGKYYLYNEKGQKLYDFGDFAPVGIVENKLIMYKLESSNSKWIHRIYSLGGNSSTGAIATGDNTKLFPNPANDYVHIEYSISKEENLHIYDINGKLVETKALDPSNTSIRLQTSAYAPGVYIWATGKTKGKFIIQ